MGAAVGVVSGDTSLAISMVMTGVALGVDIGDSPLAVSIIELDRALKDGAGDGEFTMAGAGPASDAMAGTTRAVDDGMIIGDNGGSS